MELAATVQKWIEIDIPANVCSKLKQTMVRRGGGRGTEKDFVRRWGTLYGSLDEIPERR